MKCAVGKCKQSNSKTTSVSFYSFPKDAKQRNIWIKFCNRVFPINANKEKICALHFKREDFERNLKFEMGFSNRWTLNLKPGAIPTIDTSVAVNEKKTFAFKENNKTISTNLNENKVENNSPQLNTPVLTAMIENNPQKTVEIKIENERLTCDPLNLPLSTQRNENNTQQKSDQIWDEEGSPQQTIKLEMYEMQMCNTFSTPPLPKIYVNNRHQTAELKLEDEASPQQTIKQEVPETGAGDELNIPMSTDINETNPQQKFEIKMECEESPQQTVKLETHETLTCDLLKTPLVTNMAGNNPQQKDYVVDSLLNHIKKLERKIDVLQRGNDLLRQRATSKLNKLIRQVQSLSFTNANLEKSLRRMFTEGQIKILKNSGKRHIFTKEDIAQSITLYTTSPKAYELLKKKHFPLPSVRTLQRWLQKSVASAGVSEPVVKQVV